MKDEASESVLAKREIPVLRDASRVSNLVDWGEVGEPLEGLPQTSGILLHRNPDGSSECGIWVCSPGSWRCRVERDEFCHFLDGRCAYLRDNGDKIEIVPDTIAFFEKGWTGTCIVYETIRKVYMIK